MPVLVNPKVCLDRAHCFAAGACPYGAFSHNVAAHTWEIDATKCGECPGPCLNFCDADALRWGDNLFEIDLLQQQLAGTLTAAEVAERRAQHADEERAAAEAAERAAEEAVPAIVALTQENFQAEVLQAEVPVLIDCWAAWCGPCKAFAPVFEAFAARYAGVIKCAKLNTDDEPALAQGLGVRAMPTLLLAYQGQLVDGIEGALSAPQLETWVSQRLDLLRRMFGLPPAGAAPAAKPGNASKPGDGPAPARSKAPAAQATAAVAPRPAEDKARPKLYLP